MLENNTIIKVMNRDSGTVAYKISESGLIRIFQPGETKEIPMDELRKLSWEPGGMKLLKDYFLLFNDEAIKELVGEIEPEYNYTEKEVTYILQNGTIEQFEDCLNFCPESVKNLIVDIAFKIKLNDIQKREMILQKTGSDITSMLAAEKAEQEALEKDAIKNGTKIEKEDNKVRKSTPVTEEKANGRKASIPDYKVISKK